MNTAANALAHDYLVFQLAQHQYGIALSKVAELRGHDAVCALPGTKGILAGVIRQQGFDIPVIRLEAMLGAESAAPRRDAEVLVINSGGRAVALAVESVIDVITVSPEQLRIAPDMRRTDDAKHLVGVASLGQRIILIIDIDKLIFDLHPPQAELLAA